MRNLSLPFLCALAIVWQAFLPLADAAAQSAVEALKAKLGGNEKRPPPKSYDLTVEQKARLEKLLPKAYAKLTQRAPLHVLAVGDDLMETQGPGPEAGDLLQAYPAQFLAEVAAQFLYTGGVRLIGANKGMPTKANPLVGPEITLRSLCRDGATMLHAGQVFATFAPEAHADLVLVGCGHYDAASDVELGSFARAAQALVEAVREQGGEVILLGSPMTAAEPFASSLALARPYADALRDVANELNLPFADLGDLSALTRLQPKTLAPAEVLQGVRDHYRAYFAWAQGSDLIHPRASLHEKLGESLNNQLISGSIPSPWKLSQTVATLGEGGKLSVSFTVANTTDQPLSLSLQPLPLKAWQAAEGGAQVLELKPGKKQTVQLSYSVQDAAQTKQTPLFASHEVVLRLPLLVAANGQVRVEGLTAALQPLAVLWKMDSLNNVDAAFTIENLVVNTSGVALKGMAWTAEWAGQSLKGTLDLAAGGRETLPLKFNLPTGDTRREAAPLVLTLSPGGVQLRWQRYIEVQRNLGLRETIDLQPNGRASSVKLRLDADANALFLTCDLGSLDLANDPQGTALQLDLHLDARSFGKRLGLGATQAVHVRCSAADGAGSTDNIAPWAFGTGYGKLYDAAYVTSQLTSSANGERRLTVTLPRSYLYLHEWALGNGNSELGLGVELNLWQPAREGAAAGSYPADMRFQFPQNGRPADDAERLAVLELTSEPTKRWSVIVW